MIITNLKIKIRSHRINMEDREKDKFLEGSSSNTLVIILFAPLSQWLIFTKWTISRLHFYKKGLH